MPEYFSKININDEVLNAIDVDWTDVLRETELYKITMKKYEDEALYATSSWARKEIIEERDSVYVDVNASKKKLLKCLDDLDEDETIIRMLIDSHIQCRKAYTMHVYKTKTRYYDNIAFYDSDVLEYFFEYAKIIKKYCEYIHDHRILREPITPEDMKEITPFVEETLSRISDKGYASPFQTIHASLSNHRPVVNVKGNSIYLVDIIKNICDQTRR